MNDIAFFPFENYAGTALQPGDEDLLAMCGDKGCVSGFTIDR